ncbi:hypothetical protein ACTA71_006117 [Dictyostelium dimigraforme]
MIQSMKQGKKENQLQDKSSLSLYSIRKCFANFFMIFGCRMHYVFKQLILSNHLRIFYHHAVLFVIVHGNFLCGILVMVFERSVVIRAVGNTLIGEMQISLQILNKLKLQIEIKRFIHFVTALGIDMGLIFFIIGSSLIVGSCSLLGPPRENVPFTVNQCKKMALNQQEQNKHQEQTVSINTKQQVITATNKQKRSSEYNNSNNTPATNSN